MITNNIIAFIVHVSIIIIMILFSSGSEELLEMISVLYVFSNPLIYLLIGITCLKYNGTRLKNFLSLLSIPVVGLIIWIFEITSSSSGQWIDLTGLAFYFYNPMLVGGLVMFDCLGKENFRDDSFLFLWIVFIPTIFMMIGLEIKKKLYKK